MNQVQHTQATILVVDDHPDELRSQLNVALDGRARVTVRHPQDIELSDLTGAHLVLMDYRLDDWAERDYQALAFRVQKGMALASVLREIVDAETADRLTAFALHTAHLTDVSGRIRRPYSSHVVARVNNLEWIFEKGGNGQAVEEYDGAYRLASAVLHLQGDWPVAPSASEARTRELLRLDDDAEWSCRAWRDVRECQPPVYELGGGPHGVLFLRWLLHQILPYPTFLWSVDWVAARLRVSVEDLERLRESDCELRRDLKRIEYKGILKDFVGGRWWRSAVEDYVWKLGRDAEGGPADFEGQIRERAGENVELLEVHDPVVCLNREFQRSGVASPHDAVRVRPDYWPPFADSAWMTIEAVRGDPELRAMVEPLDQYRL